MSEKILTGAAVALLALAFLLFLYLWLADDRLVPGAFIAISAAAFLVRHRISRRR